VRTLRMERSSFACKARRTRQSLVLDVPMLWRESKASFCQSNEAPSGGPPRAPKILPGTTIRVALGIQNLRARVFRGVELKDHPLRIRNARIRRRVQELDVVVREPKVYGSDVILQLLGLAGSDGHTQGPGVSR